MDSGITVLEPSLAPCVEVPTTDIAPNNRDVEFSVLVTNVIDIIQENLNSQHFTSMKHALAHVSVTSTSSKPLFPDAELAQIKQSKNVWELGELCRPYWSWNNHSLLKLIVFKSGSKDAKDELRRFRRTVNARQKLKELMSSWLHGGTSCPEGFQSMMVIVDEDYNDITSEQLDKVEKFISEITNMPVQAIQVLAKSNRNCVQIKHICTFV